MKTRLYLTLLFAFFLHGFTLAQHQGERDFPSHFLTLANGNKVFSQNIQYQTPLAETPYLLVDNKHRYEAYRVASFNNVQGEFIFTSLKGKRGTQVLLKEFEGPVSLYTRTKWFIGTSDGYELEDKKYFQSAGSYFRKQNGPLMKVNVRNLSAALADNPASMEELYKAKKINTFNKAAYVLGSALILADVYRLANPELKQSGFMPLMIAGGLTLTLPAITKKKKQRHMDRAISLYNQRVR